MHVMFVEHCYENNLFKVCASSITSKIVFFCKFYSQTIETKLEINGNLIAFSLHFLLSTLVSTCGHLTYCKARKFIFVGHSSTDGHYKNVASNKMLD